MGVHSGAVSNQSDSSGWDEDLLRETLSQEYYTHRYYQLPFVLMRSHTLTNTETGKSVQLTDKDKMIYLHMLNQYSFFSAQQRDYFENTDDIGDACNAVRRTVEKTISNLSLVGAVVKETLHTGKKRTNRYRVMNILNKPFRLDFKLKEAEILELKKHQNKF